jgi:hypothetical protein
MPARFINVSNSGQARFIRVTGNGGAIFGSGSISAGTTTTTTTAAPTCYCYGIFAENGTTTISYSRCNDGVIINLEVTSGTTSYVCSRSTPIQVSGAVPTIFACNVGGFPQECTANASCIGCGA